MRALVCALGFGWGPLHASAHSSSPEELSASLPCLQAFSHVIIPPGLPPSGSPVDARRTFHALFGMQAVALLESIKALATLQPSLADDMRDVEGGFMRFASCVLTKLEIPIAAFSEPQPPPPVLTIATYGQLGEPAIDVRWLLKPLVLDSVLRIPTDYPMHCMLGTAPKGAKHRRSILHVVADIGAGRIVDEIIGISRDGFLDRALLISSATPTQHVPFDAVSFRKVLGLAVRGQHGVEVGGPSRRYKEQGIYQLARRVDLVNYRRETLWGIFEHNMTHHHYGTTGTVWLTDGSTLAGLEDGTFDFVLGSHYLEHMLNPMKALAAIRRVLRPGGYVIMILPKKELCFDHLRGQAPFEELLYRYIHNVAETDAQHAHVDLASLQSDLSRDAPAGTWAQFRARSLRNSLNRGVHQFVYDFKLLAQIGRMLSLVPVFNGDRGLDQWIVLKKRDI